MLLYVSIILLAQIIIGLLNHLYNPMNLSWLEYSFFTFYMIFLAVVVDALVATIIRKMPEKWFSFTKKKYQVSEKEQKIYMKLGVRKWKDHIPELGSFTKFSKSRVAKPNSPKYMKRFILEVCYGITIHLWSVPFSFLILLGDYKLYTGNSNIWLTIGLPVAIVNAILILLPAFVLRFNLPKLVNIYQFALKRYEEQKNSGGANNE
jgi:hypothetical protein